jgi:signal transduction histidine kinase
MRAEVAVGQAGDTQREGRGAEQENVRLIVERLVDGVVIVDRAGLIRFVNPAAEAMFGRDARDLTGAQFGFPLVPRETTEIDVVHPERGTTVVELRAAEIRWDDEPALLVSLRDITDRKAAEERARQLAREQLARVEAEAASEAKSAFLAMMSHELRTPLNAIMGYVDLLHLELGGPLTEPQQQQLARIRTSSQHLLGLVNDVLDLSRADAERLVIARAPLWARDVADAALTVAQPLSDARGITMSAPAADAVDLLYLGDEDRVRQILVNLLSNAVKFTEPGGAIRLEIARVDTPDVGTSVHGGGPWIAFRVTDTGIGIAGDQLEAIFAPFVQLRTGHTRDRDGSGLGLTISRRLARLMGGDLTVRSTPGTGSTFTLWLPEASGGASPAAPDRVTLSGHELRVEGLADVSRALVRELDAVLTAFAVRLRADPPAPAAHSLTFSQLADHVATLLTDIALALAVLEESGAQPSGILTDGADIQRLVSERHGAQRARLGWSADAVRRECAILREEVDLALRRCFPGDTGERLAEAQAVVARLLAQAEEIILRAHERTVQSEAATE